MSEAARAVRVRPVLLSDPRGGANAKHRRNAAILRRAVEGETMEALAAAYGVSKQRIAQIVYYQARRTRVAVVGGLRALRAAARALGGEDGG